MTDSLHLTTTLPATPNDVYAAWLSSEKHTAFTGSPALVEARVGGGHRAWEGYITGRILELDPDRRIVMSWRTTEFPSASPDSRLEIVLAVDPAGTRVRLDHTSIPKGDGPKYEDGWIENYFEPLTMYFRKAPRQVAGKKRIPGKRAPKSSKKRPSNSKKRKSSKR